MQVGTGKSILNGIAIGKLKIYKKKDGAFWESNLSLGLCLIGILPKSSALVLNALGLAFTKPSSRTISGHISVIITDIGTYEATL